MRAIPRGQFIVLEGLEGAGKSTAQRHIVNELSSAGIKPLLCTHEPGGTLLASQIRTLLLQTSASEVPTTLAELLLLYAARHQLVTTVIRPALLEGTWVISDRHDLSTYAYQGAGRGISMALLQTLSDAVLEGLTPDLTLYLDVDPEIGLARAARHQERDRIERETLGFFQRARHFYQQEAARTPSIVTIDANVTQPEVDAALAEALLHWYAPLLSTLNS